MGIFACSIFLHFLSPKYLRKALSVFISTPPLFLKFTFSYTLLHFELLSHINRNINNILILHPILLKAFLMPELLRRGT